MKSFFKKLAFVMALAMVVSLAAPAAKTVVAAEEKKPLAIAYQKGAAITALNLAEVGDEEDLRFVYAPENWKDLEVVWTSSNPNVVSVDNNGVVKAEAAGQATISVAVGAETASIDVYSVAMKTFEATIGTKEERKITEKTIEIGDSFDFAFFGVLDYDMNRYNCQWLLVDPAGVAELDRATGEVTAKAAGTAVLTLVVINKVTLTEIKVADCIINIPAAEEEVVTQPAIEAVQKTQNKFEIEFTDLVAGDYTTNDVTVTCVYDAAKDTNGNGVIDSEEDEGNDTVFFKPVTVDAENNKFVVETYTGYEFVDGNEYEVVVGKYSDRFVASVGKVAKVELTCEDGYIASNGVAAKPAYLSVKMYDANGIDVTTVEVDGIHNYDRVTYEIEGGDTDAYYLVGNAITFVTPDSVVAQAFYDYYNLNGRCDSNKVTANGVEKEDWVAKVVAWAVVNEGDSNDKIDWNNLPDLWVAAGDQNRHIVALLVDSRGNYFATHKQGTTAYTNIKYKDNYVYAADYVDQTVGHSFVFAANGYYVEFETTNPDNFLLYEDGEVITYKAVTSSLKLNLHNIYNDKTEALATVPLLVKPERKITTLSTSSTAVTGVTDTMYNAFDGIGTAFDSAIDNNFKKFTRPSVKLTLKDQYNAKWWNNDDCGKYEIDFVSNANGAFTVAETIALENYAEALEAILNASPAKEKTVEFNTKYIRSLLIDDDLTTNNRSNRNAVSFKFTDGNSGRFVTVQVKLEVPNYTVEYYETSEIKPDEITYYTGTNREKTDLLVNKLEVTGSIDERAYWNPWNKLNWDLEAAINVYTTSRGYEVGYVQDKLIIAKTTADKLYAISMPVMTADVDGEIEDHFYYDDGTGMREIFIGDRVLFVVGPDGKAVPFNGIGGIDKTTGATSSALGVKVYTKSTDADTATGAGLETYYTYALEVAGDGNNDEIMEYLKSGRYTVQVRTISNIDRYTGKITLVTASAEQTASSLPITVTNSNGKIVLAGQVERDLTETADYIEEVVADAFDFNYVDSDSNFNWLGSLGWNRDTLEDLIAGVDYRVGDGYVYIKSVTFKVPVEPNGALVNNEWQWYNPDITPGQKYYYETVAVGRSVKVSNDVFFID